MSSNDGRSRNRDRHYDEVPRDSPYQDGTIGTLQTLRSSELAVSADPLPPPPLPLQPPFGPDFYSSDTEEPAIAPDLKPIRRFVPESWKNFFRGKKKDPEWDKPVSDIRYISDGVECSPPASPARPNHHSPPNSYKDPCGGSEGTFNSPKESEAMFPQDPYGSVGRHTQTARTYSEKVEEYNLRYSYMKSWAGLLRILGVVELLLGAGVFACVTAYIYKDSEWYNLFGYSQPYGMGGIGGLGSTYGGYYYSGPKTPFILVVAGLAWIATVIILVLGMSMYYRTILLDSNWWPLTEFGINVALFILYMAAAIVYVNDTNRGGLCYYPLFNTPMNALFCRVEGGQIAAMIFLFVTMIVYLISALVCLKLWRHEAARRHREYMEQQEISEPSLPSKRKMCDVATGGDRLREQEVNFKELRPTKMKPELLSGHIPAGHIPKPIVMPDYVAKYPVIQTEDERERYKAVFQDQFSEYKELSAEVQAVLRKFDELDAVMSRLPRCSENQQEHERIARIHEEFKKKKNDPTFLEKKERCDYLKNKLSHIKQRIQEYDKVMSWNVQGHS
ncbi:MARVEL domain-containing protein 2 [Ursus americanus]|uniref:MARVEL domain containing 2 n=2 Tax=Ursus TaxID=9639 RepID=A0A384C3W8_URSMA|nr:MARVEL domain-containing protein 2 [Ursus arctos]XP_040478140.1 MARVEL domain-containing protein 2 [Ursus maritimus]XP_045665790.1 MARVEL domain-containing protein 2 [Ursus americanus]XP_045665792.1 MARVEL domain-containing protein 2 [Ursus americanus]XP_045665793.1 MARVEL domain-containing protein 2 [Ursus americanus]XP_045665794.1 MARVEL domain-containing protein 2 [Ursus americanus]XP_045665795.1 MARVEL domain-containing protein 2 [Ursus americanus]XP_045665796.1 MARVEL domain-containi